MNIRLMLIITALFLLHTGGALARTRVPAPPPNAPGNVVYAPDADNKGRFGTAPSPDHPLPLALGAGGLAVAAGRAADAGGDDVVLGTAPGAFEGDDLVVDAVGNFYAAFSSIDAFYVDFRIYRSTDHGATWGLWAVFTDLARIRQFRSPVLHIAQGAEEWIYLAYTEAGGGEDDEVIVARSPLADVADFTATVLAISSNLPYGLDITSDATAFTEYYLYVVYNHIDGDTSEIHFTRSLDYGETWETPYSIGTLDSFDPQYIYPRVAYGYGHYVHVAWTYNTAQEGYDAAARYRRAPSYASGGQASWEGIQALTSSQNDRREFPFSICASQTTGQVVVGYQWRTLNGSGVVVSQDQGVSWATPYVFPDGMDRLQDVAQDPVTLTWYAGGTLDLEAGYSSAPAADLTAWSDHVALTEDETNTLPCIVLDPSHDHQPAISWGHRMPDDSWEVRFDAAWRGDDGFPNLDDGFPVDLVTAPFSDPALADLNDDGDLEIVFMDASGAVRVYQPDGTPLPGWPRFTGHAPSPSPVAIADLNGDGRPAILVPTNNGEVFGYGPDGAVLPGWPFDTGESAPASVNAGNLGPPYPYVAVVIAGTKMFYLNQRATQVPGSHAWTIAEGFHPGCAIGDHDGDGINEVVFRAGQLVLGTEMTSSSVDLYRGIGHVESGMPSLGDLDLDGDVEVVVTTDSGLIYVLDDDGSDLPGWPQVFDMGIPLSSAAIAHIRGDLVPEIAVCSANGLAGLFDAGGGLESGFPVEASSGSNGDNPVLGRVVGSDDVIFGTSGGYGWSFDNFGALNDGWPKPLGDDCEWSPAIGDIDLDSRNEIVFLTRDQLVVVDVGSAPSEPINIWGMAGHDAKRTGCSDCPEDLVTSVPGDPGAVTRVSFAAPAPNPVSGRATFSYTVPVQAVVELSVYDLRGRRVALVHREEVAPGRHMITWSGQDDRGLPLASGNYVAKLRVRGPGLNQQLIRKVTCYH